MLGTPVILTIFNRPDLTEQVFHAIAQAKPRRLFVLADGPRSAEESELCAQTRAVVEKVDWDCDVKLDVSEVNLGCRRRCASGFGWVFSQVDAAIVLEDDCVPDPTFFRFCEEMLERYRDDEQVMMITGSNYLENWKADRQSYHFSYFGSTWGWASWSRAWKHYDGLMKAWGEAETKARIRDVLADDESFAIQARRFDRIYANPEDRQSWDLPWSFTRLMHAGLTVVPAVNLISNRGFRPDGTSLTWIHPNANLPTAPMPFPIRLQASVAVDRDYDRRHILRVMGRDQFSGGPPAESKPSFRLVARRLVRRLAALLRRAASYRRSSPHSTSGHSGHESPDSR